MQKYLVIGDGQSVHLLKWISELTKYYEVYLISFRNIHPEIQSLVSVSNTLCFNLSIESAGGNIQILKKLLKINRQIKKWKPDIVNAHYLTSSGFIAALVKTFNRTTFKLVQSTWGSDILISPNKNALYKLITKFALNRATVITSDSQKMTLEIKKLTRKPVSTFTFGITSIPQINLNEKSTDVWFSNRGLEEIYRIDKVIETFEYLSSGNPKAKLYISNEGSQKRNLIELVEKKNITKKVEFLGFIDMKKQTEIYRNATYFLSLPASDSTSVSLLEALAYGCIPLLSDLDANKEWVVDGINGLIEPFNHDNLKLITENHKEVLRQNQALIKEKALFPDILKGFLHDFDLL